MTDAEAVYTAQEAADKALLALTTAYELIESSNDVPFGEMPKYLDAAAAAMRHSLTMAAEVKSALSNIKVRERV